MSNFDTDDMEDLWRVPGGDECQTNQVLYNLSRRGVEWDLLPWCQRHGMPIMAYSPLEQGRIKRTAALDAVAKRHGVTPSQVALAWTLRGGGVMSIPKASALDHVEQNRAAWGLVLSSSDRAELDQAFPPPSGRRGLDML